MSFFTWLSKFLKNIRCRRHMLGSGEGPPRHLWSGASFTYKILQLYYACAKIIIVYSCTGTQVDSLVVWLLLHNSDWLSVSKSIHLYTSYDVSPPKHFFETAPLSVSNNTGIASLSELHHPIPGPFTCMYQSIWSVYSCLTGYALTHTNLSYWVMNND